MQSAGERPEERVSSAGSALLVSALLALNLAVVGPRSVYAANIDEYNASFGSVLGHLSVMMGFLTALASVVLLLIPRRFRGRAVVFLFSLAVLAWIQGNWLLADVGLLDGGDLDLAAAASERFRDTALWLGGIAAAQFWYRPVGRLTTRLAGTFLLLQLLALPFASFFGGTPRGDAGNPLSLVPDDAIFELSRDRNVILVVLDSVTSDTFVQFADHDPAAFDRDFGGFVVYTDTLGAFPVTRFAVPAMLGAPAFDNRVRTGDYLVDALQRKSVTVPLLAQGWSVDWVSAWPFFCRRGVHSNCYAIPDSYGDPDGYRTRMAAQLVDLSMFRHAPYPLKARVYAEGRWLLQPAFASGSEPSVFVTGAADFFRDFNARVHVGRDAPTFKIVHTGGGHVPFVLDADCNEVPSRSFETIHYQQQVRCSLKQTAALLRRLRELSVYAGATIIVAGDHGASFGSRAFGTHGLTPQRLARARPLLAVKWPDARGKLRRSTAPASIEDVAATVAAAAGIAADFPGRDLATLDPRAPRLRGYGLYVQRRGTPGGYVERLERYSVGAESRRPDAWRFDGVAFSPALSLAAETVDAGVRGSDKHFAYLGWGVAERDAAGLATRPALGPAAAVFVELPAGADVELRARLRVRQAALPQTIAVEVDGEPVGSWRLDSAGFREVSLVIPARLLDGAVSTIGFLPRNHQRAESRAPASAFDLHWLRLRSVDSG